MQDFKLLSFKYEKELYTTYNNTAQRFITLASEHVKSELQGKICNSNPNRPFMDHHNNDEDSHSTAVSYRDDNHPAGEALRQFVMAYHHVSH